MKINNILFFIKVKILILKSEPIAMTNFMLSEQIYLMKKFFLPYQFLMIFFYLLIARYEYIFSVCTHVQASTVPRHVANKTNQKYLPL